jgi:hypothetical protein
MDEAHVRRRFQELRPGLAKNTYTTYTANLKRLMGVSKTLELEAMVTYFESMKPVQARNLLTALVIWDGETWRSLFNKYAKAAEGSVYSQSLTDRESINWTNLDALRKFYGRLRSDVATHNLLKRTDLNSHEERMLLGYIAWSIHFQFPMRRDLCSFQIANNRRKVGPKGNWYIPHSGTFILRVFKTAKHFKRRGNWPLELVATTKLKNLIRRFLNKRPGATYLIEKGGKPMSRGSYNNMFRFVCYRYTSRRIGTTMFRRIVVSDFLGRDPTMKQKAVMLKRMQQTSFLTQMRYRRRVD